MSETGEPGGHGHHGRTVRIRVIEVRAPSGRCPNGHRVGDEYVVGGHTPKGVCLGGFGACLPYLTALRWGGSFPWEDADGVATIGCPDCVNQVVWRLEVVNDRDSDRRRGG